MVTPTVVVEAEKTFQDSGRYLENDNNKPVFEIKKRCGWYLLCDIT